jgi:hypothetical protein
VGIEPTYQKQQVISLQKQENNLTQVVYFTGGHTLPDVITLEYPNFENPVD